MSNILSTLNSLEGVNKQIIVDTYKDTKQKTFSLLLLQSECFLSSNNY
jgi:hypothetical protein